MTYPKEFDVEKISKDMKDFDNIPKWVWDKLDKVFRREISLAREEGKSQATKEIFDIIKKLNKESMKDGFADFCYVVAKDKFEQQLKKLGEKGK